MAADLTITLHPDLVYILPALIGGFIVFFGLVSLLVKERLFLSDALVALLFGIIVGPKVLNTFNPLLWADHPSITLEISKFAIAIQVMAAGVSMPKAYLRKEFFSFSMLLGPTMLAMWLVSGAIMYFLLPKFSFLQALVVAACVTPTDPILANSVVKGRFAEKHVPINVRDLLSAESGANDGLGLPYMYLALYLLQYSSVADALTAWVVLVWVYQILLAVIIGAAAGFIFRKLIYHAERYDLIDKESFLAFWIALALFITGTLGILGSDDVLACFVAGNAFAWDNWFSNETKEAHLQEVVDMIFNYAYFIYLGASLPWDSYNGSLEGLSYGNLILIGFLLLLLRRLPAVLLLSRFIPAIKTLREALFAGWFGPIGVGAIFLAYLGQETIEVLILKTDSESGRLALEAVQPYLYPVVSFMVLCSVIVHGITVPLMYLGRHITTRSLTATSTMQNVVSRLPIIRPGQEVVLAPPKKERSSTSARLNSVVDIESGPEESSENPTVLHLPAGTQIVVQDEDPFSSRH